MIPVYFIGGISLSVGRTKAYTGGSHDGKLPRMKMLQDSILVRKHMMSQWKIGKDRWWWNRKTERILTADRDGRRKISGSHFLCQIVFRLKDEN